MTQSEASRFAALYERYYPHVYAYCRRRSYKDAVDDLVADVFLTVWRKIDSAPDDDDPIQWLYRIAYLVLTNHWRRSGRQKKLAEKLRSIGAEPMPLIPDQFVVREEVREVLEAARRLRREDQELLRLSLWEGLSMADMASVLGIKENAAKQRLHRARKRLVREHEQLTKSIAVSPAALKGGKA